MNLQKEILSSFIEASFSPDQSDTDTNSGSETSDTSDIDMGLDNKDPNLHNPMVHINIQCFVAWNDNRDRKNATIIFKNVKIWTKTKLFNLNVWKLEAID